MRVLVVNAGSSRLKLRVLDDNDVDLAPLHQPASLAALDAVRAVLPSSPTVACFDTAFQATM